MNNEKHKLALSGAERVVPELRFPEFKNDGEWEIRSVEKNIDMISGIALKSKELSEYKSGTPILRGINITEGHIRHSQKIDRFYIGDTTKINKYLVDENDIVIGMDGSKVGKNVALVSKLDKGSILIQRVARIRAINSDIKYLYQNFIYQRFITYVDNVNTSSGIPHISAKQIKDFIIGFPPKVKEQQKIADCLSSLDAVIAAATEKRDLYKVHKKGLLQQLFPAKGETQPHYRFPEFEKDGEWEVKEIDVLGNTISGLRGKKGADFGSGKPYVTYKQVFGSSFVKFDECKKVNVLNSENQNVLKKGDILFTTSSETPHEVGFASVLVDEPEETTYLNSFCFALRPFNLEELLPKFSRFLFHSKSYREKVTLIAQGSTRFNLSKSAFIKLKLRIPESKEQQKIADCLSSIDDLIEFQDQKIENLKTHKKGLMQQMFPKVKN